MRKKGDAEWANHSQNKRILVAFSSPNTPARAEKELQIHKLKLGPFLDRKLLESLNPGARKGRLYRITGEAEKLLNLSSSRYDADKNWNLTGWVLSSPKQRIALLKVLDGNKRTSEEIRQKAFQINSCLSRTSTKDMLKELINKRLIDSETIDRKRYYWITPHGQKIKEVSILKPLLSGIT